MYSRDWTPEELETIKKLIPDKRTDGSTTESRGREIVMTMEEFSRINK